MPFFTIVMQSTLRDYPGASLNRKDKLVRAIDSVLNQTFQDWELIVVADNCKETALIVCDITDERIKLIETTKQHTKWSSECRNIGKDEARGQFILYLDNDDLFSPDYLQQLYDAIQNEPAQLYIVDHFEFIQDWKQVRARVAMNGAGTANIVHSSAIKSRWPDEAHYGSEDWTFIKRCITEQPKYIHLNVAGYYICHKKGIYDK